MKLLSAFFFLSVFAFISRCAIEKSNFRSSLLTNKNKSGTDDNFRFRISLPTIRFPSSAVETNVTNQFGNIQAPIKIEKTLFPLIGSRSSSSISNYINSNNNNRNEYNNNYKETDPSSETVIPSLLNAVYLFSSICFILCLRGLSNHKTSKRGNLIGCIGIIAAILVTCSQAGFGFRYSLFLFITIPALVLGFFIAKNVSMIQMPQLVALFHSFVGLSALLVGFSKFHSSFFQNSEMNILHLLELYIGTFIAAITFIGSLVASGKLSGFLENKSLKLKEKKMINIICLISLVIFGYYFIITESFFGKTCCLYTSFVIELFLGFHLIASIGGADMPVVISALNSYSGFATALSGFLLNNSLLIISGALIGSSGAILSYIMCVSMNRNIGNIILGGWDDDEEEGAEDGIENGAHLKQKKKKRNINTITHKSTVDYLLNANKVVIVPGYGVAVSKCQRELSDICTILKGRNINVTFAIHPVAGRMPGHLNVLLAEANVPYNLVKEMEEVNATISEADIVLVIGANDTVNPASFDTNSKIFGMPVIEVWKAKKVIILKRSLATGYSNIENPLFYYDNSYLLFGDAKYTTNQMLAILNDYINITQTESNLYSKQKKIKKMKEIEEKNSIDGNENRKDELDLKKKSDSTLSFITESSSNTDMALEIIEEENFPKPRKILGLLKENGIEQKESVEQTEVKQKESRIEQKESVEQTEINEKDSILSSSSITDANVNTILVPIIPKFIPKLRKMGFRVFVEKGIGKNILIEDDEYIKYGAEIVTKEEVLQQSNIILKVDPPKEELIKNIPNNTVFISYIWPGINTNLLKKMIEKKVEKQKEEKQNITYIAIDEVPRSTRAQKLDIRSSMSNLQGYRSVLEAFYMLPKFSKASTTAAGKIKPAKVFVIGAGVAGLQAIITAKSLGAIVYAHDSRLSTEEEVKSCGGIFVKIPTKQIKKEIKKESTNESNNESKNDINVYAKEMDEEYLQMQRTIFKKIIKKCDIVICSASIPGKKSPKLVTTEMIQLMKPGSVAVDLATEFGDKENNWGGNIECSISNKNRILKGVYILGRDKIERNMPIQASELFSLNILNLLEEMGQGLHFHVDMNNDIIKSMVVVTNGNIIYSEEKKSQLVLSKQSESIFASKQDELFDDILLSEEKFKKYKQQKDDDDDDDDDNDYYIYHPYKLKSFTQKLFDSDFLFFLVLFIVLALVCFFGTVLSINDLQHLFLLSLSLIVGYYCVWSVTPSLHTPLISVTNALSGVIIIGSMIEYGNGLKDVSTILSIIATFLAALNLSGGFYVTKRMLDMFTK